MKEQLIGLEVAKEVKRLNIQLPSKYYYTLNFNSFKEDGVLHESDGSGNTGNLKGQPHLARVCTQSILKMWLRDKNTDITVITDYKKGKRVYKVGISYINKRNQIDILFSEDDNKTPIQYATYELALEAGLLSGLNLIEQ